MTKDSSFDETCAFGSDLWIAHVLGLSVMRLRKARPQLEADGFPRPDALIGRTNKADVHAWIARRRRLTDAVVVTKDVILEPKVRHDLF